jgi:ectoine hydroxylase-related dioxygenase (phytanoyl-CoA dioxygenase family)
MNQLHVLKRHGAELTDQGYTIIERFLSPEKLAETETAGLGVTPHWTGYDDAAEEEPPYFLEFADFSARIQRNVMSRELIDLVADVIGTTDLRMSLSFLWFRYAGQPWEDQELHSDLMNNSLVFPRNDCGYRQVEGILYYTDVSAGLSPTCVLPTSVDTLRPGEPHLRARSEYAHLYEHEITVEVPAGSVLLYNMTTLHRGTAFTAAEGHRISHHFVYRSAVSDWTQWRGWGTEGAKPEMASLLTQIDPRERHLFGFPLPGDPYWTDEMIQGVAARYPDMDMAPYRQGLK